MLKSVSVEKTGSGSIPKVLLQAKKEAAMQVSKKGKSWNKGWDKGPWDKGHWANRR